MKPHGEVRAQLISAWKVALVVPTDPKRLQMVQALLLLGGDDYYASFSVPLTQPALQGILKQAHANPTRWAALGSGSAAEMAKVIRTSPEWKAIAISTGELLPNDTELAEKIVAAAQDVATGVGEPDYVDSRGTPGGTNWPGIALLGASTIAVGWVLSKSFHS